MGKVILEECGEPEVFLEKIKNSFHLSKNEFKDSKGVVITYYYASAMSHLLEIPFSKENLLIAENNINIIKRIDPGSLEVKSLEDLVKEIKDKRNQ